MENISKFELDNIYKPYNREESILPIIPFKIRQQLWSSRKNDIRWRDTWLEVIILAGEAILDD